MKEFQVGTSGEEEPDQRHHWPWDAAPDGTTAPTESTPKPPLCETHVSAVTPQAVTNGNCDGIY